MPGKQAGLSAACWPVRLLGDSPHLYVYSANNPSEGSIARRRGAATLVSYLSPPLEQAGLYRGLARSESGDPRRCRPARPMPPRWMPSAGKRPRCTWPGPLTGVMPIRRRATCGALRGAARSGDAAHPDSACTRVGRPAARRASCVDLLVQVAAHARPELGLPALAGSCSPPRWACPCRRWLESTRPAGPAGRAERAQDVALGRPGPPAGRRRCRRRGANAASTVWAPTGRRPLLRWLAGLAADLTRDVEPQAVIHAAGRGLHLAVAGRRCRAQPHRRADRAQHPRARPFQRAHRAGLGRRPAQWPRRCSARYRRERGDWPRALALVLWGTDNLKTGGEGIAQALWLLGAEPYRDALGRVTGVRLLPLASLGRPRIDVVLTCSGIFRDLLPNQLHAARPAVRLAADGRRAARAELRAPQRAGRDRRRPHRRGSRHARLQQCAGRLWRQHQFSGRERRLGRRRGAGRDLPGPQELRLWPARRRPAGAPLLASALRRSTWPSRTSTASRPASATSTTISSTWAACPRPWSSWRARARRVLCSTCRAWAGACAACGEMVAVESRTKLLNPRWTDGMLRFGYEGVREIGVRVANTLRLERHHGRRARLDLRRPGRRLMSSTRPRREQMAALNPNAYQGLVGRLLEAEGRGFWQPAGRGQRRLRRVYGEAEDLVEPHSISPRCLVAYAPAAPLASGP